MREKQCGKNSKSDREQSKSLTPASNKIFGHLSNPCSECERIGVQLPDDYAGIVDATIVPWITGDCCAAG